MASLVEKVQTLISANLHALVDKALQSNSLAVVDQYIRQVEDSLADLEDAVATVGGQLKTLERKSNEYRGKADELDKNIDLLLVEGREDLALAAQSKLNSTKRLAESYGEQVERQRKEFEQLQGARLKLEARLTTVRQERQELQALLELAKSKEIAQKTMESLDSLAGLGDADISRVADSIRARLDKAQARSEMAAGRLDAQMDEILDRREIDGQLAARRRRLGLNQ
jgi:phage shock protein A